ncbi:MAG: hypothetical protein AAGU27_06045 [Dehalobacterium sp.]
MTVEKKLEVNEEIESTDVSMIGDSIIIRLKDRLIAVDKTLTQTDNVSLPETITQCSL